MLFYFRLVRVESRVLNRASLGPAWSVITGQKYVLRDTLNQSGFHEFGDREFYTLHPIAMFVEVII